MQLRVLIILALTGTFAYAADTCDEAESNICNKLAFCEGTTSVPTNRPSGVTIPASSDGKFSCFCAEGVLGHGYGSNGCSSKGWNVRVVYNARTTPLDSTEISTLLSNMGITCQRGSTSGCDHVYQTVHTDYQGQVGVNVLFPDTGKTAAEALAGSFTGARLYRWTGGTTSDPITVLPAGMEVTNVLFVPSCAKSGCWEISADFTVGHSDVKIAGMVMGFNTFYLPYAVGSDALSYDYDYPSTVDDTFLPKNFPCRTSGSPLGTDQKTMCCFGTPYGTSFDSHSPGAGFLGNYRPSEAFSTYAVQYGKGNAACATILPETVEPTYSTALGFLGGKFTGMPDSPGFVTMTPTDSFVGMYTAVIRLDEVELRKRAGVLKGTVGVEHTIDTFLGYVNFKAATTTEVLDSMATQTNIHLEKTSFFTVSTHGTNDYTFLEYVNLRLVAVYKEDKDFSGASESGAETVRTNSQLAAHYIQVTFTLGSQYGVNTNSGLIPDTSVRAGKGTFFDGAALAHKCVEYKNLDSSKIFADKATFDQRFTQQCAPAAVMCSSPATIPDSFVAFNIPLGIDYFPKPSTTLSENIFVDMVISAVDNVARAAAGATAPNAGGEPWQMKTTLTASIPVVDGGINIFCDGLTSKTDLKDVANVDIVVGSASTAAELTRLRIKKDIASTQLSPNAVTQINSDSIEAGLMTLVIKGQDSYFQTNSGRNNVQVVLEDVITIHIMQDDGNGGSTGNSKYNTVMSLVSQAPADNSNSNGLITDGYALNGAFYFTIDRAAQRAYLEPSTSLLTACPFNPPRPSAGNAPLETCVTRRDVRYRNYPARTGAKSTAMEICVAGSCPTAWTSDESKFFVTIFGDNDYAKKLAVDFAGVINGAYQLNGRYRRAYWINPGYEWTPTQTGGTSIFSVSQRLFLFALVTLDEGIANVGAGKSVTPPGPVLRRRMLLQSTTEDGLKDGQSGFGGEAVQFQTSPTTLMAKAFDVPADRVATFKVQVQLTEAEACMSEAELQAALRDTLDDYLSSAASPYHTVQVTQLSVNKAGVQCSRRALRSLLASFSAATADVTMLVVFKEGTESTISLEKLAQQAGIKSVDAVNVSPKVNTAPKEGTDYVPPPSDNNNNIGGSSSPAMRLSASFSAVLLCLVSAFVAM